MTSQSNSKNQTLISSLHDLKINRLSISILIPFASLVLFSPLMGSTQFTISDMSFRSRDNAKEKTVKIKEEKEEEEKKILSANAEIDVNREIIGAYNNKNEKNNASSWRLYRWGQSATDWVKQCRKQRWKQQQLKLKKQNLLDLQKNLQKEFPAHELSLDDVEKIQQDHLDFAATVELKASEANGSLEQFAKDIIQQEENVEFATLMESGKSLAHALELFFKLPKLKKELREKLQSSPSDDVIPYRDPKIPLSVIEQFESTLEQIGINRRNVTIAVKSIPNGMASASEKYDVTYTNRRHGETMFRVVEKITNASGFIYIDPNHINALSNDLQYAETVALHEAMHLMHGHSMVRTIISNFLKNPQAAAALSRQQEFTADVFSATQDPHSAYLLYEKAAKYALYNIKYNNAIHSDPETIAQAIFPILRAHRNNGALADYPNIYDIAEKRRQFNETLRLYSACSAGLAIWVACHISKNYINSII